MDVYPEVSSRMISLVSQIYGSQLLSLLVAPDLHGDMVMGISRPWLSCRSALAIRLPRWPSTSIQGFGMANDLSRPVLLYAITPVTRTLHPTDSSDQLVVSAGSLALDCLWIEACIHYIVLHSGDWISTAVWHVAADMLIYCPMRSNLI